MTSVTSLRFGSCCRRSITPACSTPRGPGGVVEASEFIARTICRGRAGVKRFPQAISPFPMKAIRIEEFGGPSVLRVAEFPAPEPGPGEVRVRVQAAGVNPVETYIRAGQYAA